MIMMKENAPFDEQSKALLEKLERKQLEEENAKKRAAAEAALQANGPTESDVASARATREKEAAHAKAVRDRAMFCARAAQQHQINPAAAAAFLRTMEEYDARKKARLS